MKSYTADKLCEGVRLDKFVLSKAQSLPTSMMYKYIRKKRIKVNGKKEEISYRLKIGDVIELYINDEFFEKENEDTAYLKASSDIDVVFEDENIIVVNKPSGLVVHEDDEGENVNTLIARIKKYLSDKGEFDGTGFTPALCNRIDRNTCGLVIAAKNEMALRVMNEKIRDREIKKFYLCVVQGHLEEKEATKKAFLLKDETKKQVTIFDKPQKDAKTILTKYKVLKEGTLTSLLEVELLTGRTHQIRAHMSYLGHPLLGDGKYGNGEFNRRMGRKYQALCAYKLIFDFDTESSLSYLNGREITIGREKAEAMLS